MPSTGQNKLQTPSSRDYSEAVTVNCEKVAEFDSSLGDMLEGLAIAIAKLSYKVERRVEGTLARISAADNRDATDTGGIIAQHCQELLDA